MGDSSQSSPRRLDLYSHWPAKILPMSGVAHSRNSNKLKLLQKLLQEPLLPFPYFKRSLILQTDASHLRLWFVLAQEQCDKVTCLITNVSCVLLKHKNEELHMEWVSLRPRLWSRLFGYCFNPYTDCKALKFLFKMLQGSWEWCCRRWICMCTTTLERATLMRVYMYKLTLLHIACMLFHWLIFTPCIAGVLHGCSRDVHAHSHSTWPEKRWWSHLRWW